MINVQPVNKALDICCGTGDLALALARRGAETVGLDFNEHMLRIAEGKKSKLGKRRQRRRRKASEVLLTTDHGLLTHLSFIRGDAQSLPFPDNSFDIVTIGYGLRNLASWETGLREMERVAKPGGKLLVLDFGKPQNPLWRGLYFGYLRLFVPLLGRWVCGNAKAYDYILESLNHYPAQRGVAAKMQEFALMNVRIINLLGGAMSINYGQKQAEASH